MKIYKLNKTVLSLRPHPADFLKGLTSNVVTEPYNAFLNIHGRIIATFEQLQVDADEIWIVIESPFVSNLMAHIDRYVKLSKAEVVQKDYNVYFDIYQPFEAVDEKMKAITLKQGRIIITEDDLVTTVSEEEFTLYRVRNQIPLQGTDYTDQFVLNVSEDKFVSFSKGCFLGQEPVAKVHNRSRPTWQLVVKYEDECDQEMRQKMTSKVCDPESGRIRGFLFINTANT